MEKKIDKGVHALFEISRNRGFCDAQPGCDFGPRKTVDLSHDDRFPLFPGEAIKRGLQPAQFLPCNSVAVRPRLVVSCAKCFHIRDGFDGNDIFPADTINEKISCCCKNEGPGGIGNFPLGGLVDMHKHIMAKIFYVVIAAPSATQELRKSSFERQNLPDKPGIDVMSSHYRVVTAQIGILETRIR